MTQREIAEQVGLSQQGVAWELNKQTANAEHLSSTGNGSNGKDKARQAMAASGMTQREIAEQVGLTAMGVNKVVNQTANAEQFTSSGNGAAGKDKARQAMAATVARKPTEGGATEARRKPVERFRRGIYHAYTVAPVLGRPVGLARVLCPYTKFDSPQRDVLQSWTRNGPGQCVQH